jgi:transposase
LASARGLSVRAISEQVGQAQSTVRGVIHLFNTQGEACVRRGSHRPKSAAPVLDECACLALRELAHRSPREFGQARSLWSLESLAQVAWEQGLTPRLMSDESMRRALGRVGVSWQRAKAWIVSPDPHYERKKRGVND